MSIYVRLKDTIVNEKIVAPSHSSFISVSQPLAQRKTVWMLKTKGMFVQWCLIKLREVW